MASVIIQEWALDTESRVSDPFSFSLGTSNPDVESLSTLLIDRIGSPAPSTYHEMAMVLQRIYSECSALLTAFSVEGKLSKDKVPSLPKRIDPLSNTPDVFSIESAHHAVTTQFDILAGKLSKNAIKNALPSLQDRRNKVMGSVGYFSIMKEKYDVQVMAGIAGASCLSSTTSPSFHHPLSFFMSGPQAGPSQPSSAAPQQQSQQPQAPQAQQDLKRRAEVDADAARRLYVHRSPSFSQH